MDPRLSNSVSQSSFCLLSSCFREGAREGAREGGSRLHQQTDASVQGGGRTGVGGSPPDHVRSWDKI